MRTLKAFLFAPLGPLALMYVWTIAHFEMPYSVITLINPVVWLFALVIGLPACYVAELAFALPIHFLFERLGLRERRHYVVAGAVVGAVACWIWAATVRGGPLPLHRDVWRLVTVGIPAGAIGGIRFWQIAIGGSAGAQWLTIKSLLIVVSPLFVLYLGVYAVAGRHFTWQEWAALPLADPGGFGIFIVVAVFLSLSLSIDRWRRLTRHQR